MTKSYWVWERAGRGKAARLRLGLVASDSPSAGRMNSFPGARHCLSASGAHVFRSNVLPLVGPPTHRGGTGAPQLRAAPSLIHLFPNSLIANCALMVSHSIKVILSLSDFIGPKLGKPQALRRLPFDPPGWRETGGFRWRPVWACRGRGHPSRSGPEQQK